MRKLLVSAGAVGLVALVAYQAGAIQRERPQLQAQVGPRAGQYNFKVEIEGVNQGAIGEIRGVDGLSAVTEVIEFQDGEDLVLRKRPGRVKYGDITLKRGYRRGDDPLLTWYRDIQDGKLEKKAVVLGLYDASGEEVARYNLLGCWPAKWYGPRQVAPGAVVPIEKIEFAIEKVEIPLR